MKPTAYLFFIPLLFFSIFSCKKSDDALARVKPKTVMGIDDTPDNIRVFVQNLPGNEPYIRIMLLANDEFGPEIESRWIVPSTGVSALLFFTLPAGTPYCLKVYDNTGVVTYTTPTVASSSPDTYFFPVPAPGTPPVLPPVSPVLPPPSTPIPDPAPEPGKAPFTLTVHSWSGQEVVEAAIVPNVFGTPLEVKPLVYDSAGVRKYKKEVTFNITPGTTFIVRLRDDNGSIVYGPTMIKTNAPEFYTFW